MRCLKCVCVVPVTMWLSGLDFDLLWVRVNLSTTGFCGLLVLRTPRPAAGWCSVSIRGSVPVLLFLVRTGGLGLGREMREWLEGGIRRGEEEMTMGS